jgi:hypothetical protein
MDDRHVMAMPESTSEWDLTAPESLVLRDGPSADRAQVLKLGLLELVTRGSLRLVDVNGRTLLGRSRLEKVLASGHRPLPTTGPLAPIASAFYNATPKTLPDGTSGRTIASVARAFAKGARTGGNRYRDETILPGLATRGLYRRERYRLLGVFQRTRWVLTPDGERRRAELSRLLAEGERELSTHLLRDPREAAAVLAGTGAAALLMTSSYPELNELSQRLRATIAGDGGVTSGGSPVDTGPPDGAVPNEPSPSPTDSTDAWSTDGGAFELGSIDVGGLDLSALDGVDAAFGAIDSGVDAGGGGDGGGGDGGGGDGGGGD